MTPSEVGAMLRRTLAAAYMKAHRDGSEMRDDDAWERVGQVVLEALDASARATFGPRTEVHYLDPAVRAAGLDVLRRAAQNTQRGDTT